MSDEKKASLKKVAVKKKKKKTTAPKKEVSKEAKKTSFLDKFTEGYGDDTEENVTVEEPAAAGLEEKAVAEASATAAASSAQLKQVKKRKTKVKQVKKAKEHMPGFNWFFWISAIVIAIPVGYFIYLLLSASQESNVPILGDRLDYDITQTISQEQVSQVKSNVGSLEGVDGVEVNLIVQTLRVYVDGSDAYTEEQLSQLAKNAYSSVTSVLDESIYFSQYNNYKQYDCEVVVYNNKNAGDNLIMISLVKNSRMEEATVQVLTTPLNEELANELHNPTTVIDDPDEPETPVEDDEFDDGIVVDDGEEELTTGEVVADDEE